MHNYDHDADWQPEAEEDNVSVPSSWGNPDRYDDYEMLDGISVAVARQEREAAAYANVAADYAPAAEYAAADRGADEYEHEPQDPAAGMDPASPRSSVSPGPPPQVLPSSARSMVGQSGVKFKNALGGIISGQPAPAPQDAPTAQNPHAVAAEAVDVPMEGVPPPSKSKPPRRTASLKGDTPKKTTVAYALDQMANMHKELLRVISELAKRVNDKKTAAETISVQIETLHAKIKRQDEKIKLQAELVKKLRDELNAARTERQNMFDTGSESGEEVPVAAKRRARPGPSNANKRARHEDEREMERISDAPASTQAAQRGEGSRGDANRGPPSNAHRGDGPVQSDVRDQAPRGAHPAGNHHNGGPAMGWGPTEKGRGSRQCGHPASGFNGGRRANARGGCGRHRGMQGGSQEGRSMDDPKGKQRASHADDDDYLPPPSFPPVQHRAEVKIGPIVWRKKTYEALMKFLDKIDDDTPRHLPRVPHPIYATDPDEYDYILTRWPKPGTPGAAHPTGPTPVLNSSIDGLGNSTVHEEVPGTSSNTNSFTSDGRQVSIKCWNIAGRLATHLSHPTFQSELENYDINLFQETHLYPTQELALPIPSGYNIHAIAREPLAGTFDIPWGGVAAIVRTDLRAKVETPLCGPDLLVMRIGAVCLFNTYVLPNGSSWEHWTATHPMEKLSQLIGVARERGDAGRAVLQLGADHGLRILNGDSR
ncbi:hypothetical protein C8R43DRAFT_958583 [Mycena crocata]|nr:hypothetical protein C8R43DRAFT_958583 [Mycena crocata]